jgi:ATP-dependent RNA helicase RhlE
MKFENLKLIEPILKAIRSEGYTTPTPIQEQAIPLILEGRDLVGCAQTGTGKTAAFAIPMLQMIYEAKAATEVQAAKRTFEGRKTYDEHRTFKTPRDITAMILTPTRELAAQIGDSITAYGRYTGIRHTVIFGGVSQQAQTNALRNGVDILVATPGRLLDLMGQGFISLDRVRMFVLDEADRMLDMGFSHDVKRIMAKLPVERQTLLFSATMPKEISNLADTILTHPARVAVTPISSTVETIDQAVYYVEKKDKESLLIQLLKSNSIDSALVFTRTKHGADKVARDLVRARISAQAIHGNKSQTARQLALNSFKAKQTRVLVATDIASRGIDVQELSHVINYDIPNEPETYVHRIGRTGRAGLGGTALSFCDNEEKSYLKDIQKLILKKIPVIQEHPYTVSSVGRSNV